MAHRPHKLRRTGGVYIVVLGTSMIVALLGLSALLAQRVQNRMLVAAADIRQAQLNASSAVELALLTMKQDANWRANYPNGFLVTDHSTSAGTCTVKVTDPIDHNLADNPDEPVVILGIGTRGKAEQHCEVTIDPRRQPLGCLRETLVTGNATGISNWGTVFDYYQTNGTQININSLPTSTPNLGRNVGMESVTGGIPTHWTGSAPGIPTAEVTHSTTIRRSGSASLRVRNRSEWYSGAAQPIDSYVKPDQQYYVEAWILMPSGIARSFWVSVYTKGSGAAQLNNGPATLAVIGVWTRVSATITAPSWSGNLEYAFVKFGGTDNSNTADYYLDDFTIRETTTGRFLYRQSLGPTIGNQQGIYWINCGGNKLIIERSRILGTLLVLNPGAGSCIANGPNHMSAAESGYPTLLVHGDFAIRATNRILSEVENGVDYNRDGTNGNYIYPSEIRGMVAVSGNLTFTNSPRLLGQAIVGGNLTGTADIDYDPESLLNPPPGFQGPYSYVRRPISTRKVVLP